MREAKRIGPSQRAFSIVHRSYVRMSVTPAIGIVARLDPVQFETGFLGWNPDALPPRPPEDVVAGDGRTVRTSTDAG
jgi:hypothetical protein